MLSRLSLSLSIPAVRDGTWKEEGYPQTAYGVSKMLMHTYSRILARELAESKPGFVVATMNPGMTATEMTNFTGKGVAEGADTAVWLCVAPASHIGTGRFWQDRKETEW